MTVSRIVCLVALAVAAAPELASARPHGGRVIVVHPGGRGHGGGHHGGGRVYPRWRHSYRVRVAPPPMRVEVRTVAPSPRHRWRAGYWGWQNNRHVWMVGGWVAPQTATEQVWVDARWVQEDGEWVFEEGHWE